MSFQKIIGIVEDAKDVSCLLKDFLEKEGYEVFVAQDGLSALKMIERRRPSLILLDIMMPDLDGYAVLQKIKSNDKTRSIAVIMLTARNLEGDIQKALDLGADDYVTKPFYPKLLLKRIHTILSRQERRDAHDKKENTHC